MTTSQNAGFAKQQAENEQGERATVDREAVLADAHPSRERCGWCKEYSGVGFWVPNEIWRQVVPTRFSETIACVRCFVRMADERLVKWDEQIEFFPVSLWTHMGRCLPHALPTTKEESHGKP